MSAVKSLGGADPNKRWAYKVETDGMSRFILSCSTRSSGTPKLICYNFHNYCILIF